MNNNDDRNKRIIKIIILLIIIIILLYLLILKFGNIQHHGQLVPTGNVDIFELDCGCGCDQPAFGEDGNLIVFDKEKIWDNNELRIFTNPAYEYQSKIAPGSENSYTFVIRNNNNFDVLIDFSAKENNPYNVNMKYKLKHLGNYVLGNNNTYIDTEDLKLNGILLKAYEQKAYVLDWKWVDSDHDTEAGFEVGAKYKLTLTIKATEVE